MDNRAWYLQISEDGEIEDIARNLFELNRDSVVPAPLNFDPEKQDIYRFKNGELFIDEELKKRKETAEERQVRKIQAASRLQEYQASKLIEDPEITDTIKAFFTILLPEWTPRDFQEGDYICYDDVAYKCIRDHTSTNLPTYSRPDIAPDMWERCLRS